MSEVCKHPIEHLNEIAEIWTDHHPYGEDDYKSFYLACDQCDKQVKIFSQYRDTHNGILTKTYEELTERRLDLKEAKALFKKNNDLFHAIKDMNEFIKNEVMGNPVLEKRIAQKQKLIQKHKEELRELITKYNGGKPPFLYGDR